MSRKLLSSLFVLMSACFCYASQNFELDKCASSRSWKFIGGGEFPGAKGGVRSENNKLFFEYDFTEGGKYVAYSYRRKLPEKIKSFQFKLTPKEECVVNYRITGKTGHVFQGKQLLLKKGETQTLVFSVEGPWSDSWGGESERTNPKERFREFQLLVCKSSKTSLNGGMLIENFSVNVDKLPEKEFIGKDIRLNGCGWSIKGEWNGLETTPELELTARNIEGKDASLEITLPQMARNSVKRIKLEKESKLKKIYYDPPFLRPRGINENNKYAITIKVKNSESASCVKSTLTGKKALGINFGSPISSLKIKSSIFGTCAHFSYGLSGPFSGWKEYEKLTDMISKAGLKWIRDGAGVEKDKDGHILNLRQRDIDWIKYARSKDIDVILVIGMSAGEPLPEFLKRVEIIVRDTKKLVKVYELGNEPNNCGAWIKTYGGAWNGKERDNSTSEWVKAHLKYTNAAAELIKKLSPNSTVIGLGAPSPTNFRYLDLGLSKAVDGVVDHPYTYSLPPEKIPFGWNTEKRDGVRVGDINDTFEGLIDSYIEKFKATGKMRSLWLTEFGFTTFWFDGEKNEKGLYAGFSEEAQAVYLVRRFILGLALPVAVSCQYDFLDDYGSGQHEPEANFGIIRSDDSPKPAYYAIQRMTSLFNGFVHDKSVNIELTKAPLHRSCKRNELVRHWDDHAIMASNGVNTYGFLNPSLKNERMLALWSVLPYSGEFNNRVVSLKIKGWKEFNSRPVAIDIVTGETFDIPFSIEKDSFVIEDMTLKRDPVVIKFIKK